jgi:hypothetical protein
MKKENQKRRKNVILPLQENIIEETPHLTVVLMIENDEKEVIHQNENIKKVKNINDRLRNEVDHHEERIEDLESILALCVKKR